MEALAAIGLASNILQFLDLGYKVFQHSKELYSSGKDASSYNETLELTTREIKRFSLDLEYHMGAALEDDQAALLKLSLECQKCSDELLALLGRLKNKKPVGFIRSFQLAFRDVRTRDEKARLEQTLDLLSKRMDTLLNKLTREETLEKLKTIEGVSDDLVTTNKSILELLRRMNTRNELQDRLQNIMQRFHDSLSHDIVSKFIAALDARELNQRFEEVSKAHASTFEWLLSNPGVTGEVKSNQSHNRHMANANFVNWLESGQGIFHISGKPGAGKSTLMKFLCQNPKTEKYLKQWCGEDRLIFTQSFFWRQGILSQKNLVGLMRSILHQIFFACPDLVLAVELNVAHPISYTSNSSLDAHVQQAFERLLSNPISFQNRRFVLFIDGLDEYEGRHLELSGGHLKICVSSREWNEFMVGFAQCPKLQLHHCTEGDIKRFVHDKLNSLQRHLLSFEVEEMDAIEEEIVQKAEGVFVWVRLALNAVEDSVINGDGISDVRKRVATFPKELDDLYQYLFDSIPESSRVKSFESLRLTHFLRSDHGLPLRQYAFLDRIIAEPRFAVDLKIAETPIDLSKLLQTTRRQIYGRCKGFLEISPSSIWNDDDDGEVKFMHSTRMMDEKVGDVGHLQRFCYTMLATMKYGSPQGYYANPVTKRSGCLYIEGSPFVNDIVLLMDKECAERMADVATRDVHLLTSPQPWYLEYLHDLEVVSRVRLSSFEDMKPFQFRRAHEGKIDPHANSLKLDWPCLNRFIFTAAVQIDIELHTQSCAIQYLLYEFLEPKNLEPFAHACQTANRPALPHLLTTGNLMFLCDYSTYHGLIRTVRLMFEAGACANHPFQLYHNFTILDSFIYLFLFPPEGYRRSSRYSDRYWNSFSSRETLFILPFQLLHLCLRYGARSQLELCFGPCYRRKKKAEEQISIRIKGKDEPDIQDNGGDDDDDDDDDDDVWDSPCYTTPGSPLVSMAKRHNGVLHAGDLFRLWFPDDFKVLQALLDENEKQNGAVELPYSPSLEYRDERDYASIEFGQPPISRHTLFQLDKEMLSREYEKFDFITEKGG
ncbi:hypothetical protein F5Y16DRAFT_412582 [Xylariaceae sp. FL0255]|nr:hypothetical protein F5Y16DRAFT_412582 [Xylariaceae sp. FL0255]